MPSQPTILAVFAHPDDETGVMGTLALYTSQGGRAYVACATRGEEGQISDPSLATPESLGRVREQELREACRIMGLEEPIFLGYRDSGMAGTPANHRPDSLAQADPKEVVGKVVRLIRELRPQVVITFDRTGVYGHPDHLAIHRYATEAFFQAGRGEAYPEQRLSPHAPQRLYYMAVPRSAVLRMAERMAAQGRSFSEDMPSPDNFGTPDEEITTYVDVSPFASLKQRALLAHRTQMGPDSPLAAMTEEDRAEWLGVESFRREYPPLSPGLRERALL